MLIWVRQVFSLFNISIQRSYTVRNFSLASVSVWAVTPIRKSAVLGAKASQPPHCRGTIWGAISVASLIMVFIFSSLVMIRKGDDNYFIQWNQMLVLVTEVAEHNQYRLYFLRNVVYMTVQF